MQFEEPNIHYVRRVTASARTVNPDTLGEFTTFALQFHGSGEPAEFKAFFVRGASASAYAHALAAAINAVPAVATMADLAAAHGLAEALAGTAEDVG